MKKYIIIEADTNDGDYITRKTEVSNQDLEEIKPMLKAIKEFKPYAGKVKDWDNNKPWMHDYNYATGECVREDLGQLSADEFYKDIPGFDKFDGLVPHGEYGVHTIESVTLLEVAREEELL